MDSQTLGLGATARPEPTPAQRVADRDRGWLRKVLYRPLPLEAVPFGVVSRDGVPIAGYAIAADPQRPALLYAHGFLSGSRHRRVPAFLRQLSQDWAVYAMDFRGHGRSGGSATFAGGERLDLEAVVAMARARGHQQLIAVGSSMGGAACIRLAAKGGAVDGVVTIGAYARAAPLRRASTELLRRLAFHPGTGSRLLAWSLGSSMGRASMVDGEPEDLVAAMADKPLLLIHGGLDPLIPPAEAKRLLAAAGPRTRLVLRPLLGHDQPHLGQRTADLILRWALAEGLR